MVDVRGVFSDGYDTHTYISIHLAVSAARLLVSGDEFDLLPHRK